MSDDRPPMSIILRNALSDPTYCPYCGRCEGLQRMERVEPFRWMHKCGAIHDERENAEAHGYATSLSP